MSGPFYFSPPRRLGLALQLGAILLLVIGGAWGFWQAFNTPIGPTFVFYLLAGLIAVVALLLLGYRAYALWNAIYLLERNGVFLRWGWRAETIPMHQVTWVRLAGELEEDLPLPLVRWPGSINGLRRLKAGGKVEYMAATIRQMVLIGTPSQAYAISPEDPAAFLSTFERLMELGTISSIDPISQHPSFLLARVWRTPPARGILLAGLALNLFLLVWVSIAIPGRQQVLLGVLPGREPVPAIRLLLLPVLSATFFLVDFTGGLFLFRRGDRQRSDNPTESQPPALMMAYLLWGTGAVTAVLFLLAIGSILRAG